MPGQHLDPDSPVVDGSVEKALIDDEWFVTISNRCRIGHLVD